ncbi:hemolysin family protein [Stomatohabitans albus]|uniref:hemolysin family protein n=1 Tax=Stomatohabitans albus TaxID=3110766 RepID=UPI00300D2E9A
MDPISLGTGFVAGLLGAAAVGYFRRVAAAKAIAPVDEQIKELVDEADEAEITEETGQMIAHVLALPDTRVREIMLPRPDMRSVTLDMTLDEVTDVILEYGHSRLPVRGDADNRDQIIGLVYSKDVLKHIHLQGAETKWHDLIRQPYVVPESTPVDRLLRELQSREVHMALVVNEFGDLTGLCTIEDVLEEIVGEIVDEHDDELPLYEEVNEHEWLVDARLGIHAMSELLGMDLPDDDWDTVGGLVFNHAGHVPEIGDVIVVDHLDVPDNDSVWGSVELHCEDVEGNRVEQVRVIRLPLVAKTDED